MRLVQIKDEMIYMTTVVPVWAGVRISRIFSLTAARIACFVVAFGRFYTSRSP